MPRGNFLSQFGGEKPPDTVWGLEIRDEVENLPIVTMYCMPSLTEALRVRKHLKLKHPTANIRVVGDCMTL